MCSSSSIFLILMKKIIYLSIFITMALFSMSYESGDLDFEEDIYSEEPIKDPTIIEEGEEEEEEEEEPIISR